MSYSFAVKAPTKVEAKQAVEAAFDKVVSQQPIHARDRAAAVAAAASVIDLLVEDPDLHIGVSVSGYVSWREALNAEGSNPLSGASVSTSASLVTPEVKQG
jgi:hypothetical protein